MRKIEDRTDCMGWAQGSVTWAYRPKQFYMLPTLLYLSSSFFPFPLYISLWFCRALHFLHCLNLDLSCTVRGLISCKVQADLSESSAYCSLTEYPLYGWEFCFLPLSPFLLHQICVSEFCLLSPFYCLSCLSRNLQLDIPVWINILTFCHFPGQVCFPSLSVFIILLLLWKLYLI